MKQELQNQLFEKYPKLFIEKDLPMSVTCMCWGIETGDGWYNILDKLCGALQWSTDENGHPQVVITQIKEKFGDLRFYTDGDDDYQRGLITMSEIMTGITCEVCGCPGTMENVGGWVSTQCESCKNSND